jgi:16S rRNA (uracil1498-N3)-methyltransferase
MDIPYFFEPGIPAGSTLWTLSDATAKHVVQVLRMKTGEPLHLTNGQGYRFTAVILSADKRSCQVLVQNQELLPPPARKISIGIGLVKNTSRLEWFVEKATELGITEIRPLISGRTNREHFRFDRIQQICVAAMLQSRQCWLPVLHQPAAVTDVISATTYDHQFIAHCLEQDKQVLPPLPENTTAQVLIGPEGDFTEQEIELALQKGYKAVTLGNTRLRTETAGIAAATLLMLQ